MRAYLLWLILTKRERDLLVALVSSSKDFAIENYAMAMGETYQEFSEQLSEFYFILKPNKVMKKRFHWTHAAIATPMLIAFLIVLLSLLSGCKESNSSPVNFKEEKPERIEGKFDDNYLSKTSFAIVEVDGHEYLTYYQGGIVHLESCKASHELRN